MGLASRIGLKKHLDRQEQSTLAWVTHFAFGTGAGAVYGPAARVLPLPPVAGGIGFGLLVWATSYLGWLPALRLTTLPDKQTAAQVSGGILQHLAYGVATIGIYRGIQNAKQG